MNKAIKLALILGIGLLFFMLSDTSASAYCACSGTTYYCVESYLDISNCIQPGDCRSQCTAGCTIQDPCRNVSGYSYICSYYTVWETNSSNCCSSGCTPSCPSYAPNSSGSYGYVSRSCRDGCGDTYYRRCYCSSPCSPSGCPSGTSTSGSYGFYRTYSCTNDCGHTSSRSCYCTSNCTPTSCPSGTSESGSYGLYNTYSCTNACGRSQSRSCYCTSNCTPASCPSGTSETGSYGFYRTYSCTNACGRSQSRDCSCTSNCTPASCPAGTSESGTHGFYNTYSCTNMCGTSQSRSCNCDSACTPSQCNPANQHETKQSGVWYGDNDLKTCANACGESQSRNCYWVCERATCTDLASVTVNNVNRYWLDDCPVGADCEQVVKDVPITATVYPGCPSSETKTCYYPNIDPVVVSVQAQDTGDVIKGYTSTTDTGLDLNNPARVTAVYSDADGVEDIAAIYVWWSTSDTKNFVTPNYLGSVTPKTANNQNFGFMVRRNRSTNAWDGVYVPRIDSNSRWVRVGTISESLTIQGPTPNTLANIYNFNISENLTTNEVTLSLMMNFVTPNDGGDVVYTDQYNLWGTVNDQVGFLPFSETDEIWHPDRWVDAGNDWNLDMINPENLSISIGAIAEGQLRLNLQGNDNGDAMNLAYARLDACRTDPTGAIAAITTTDGDSYMPSSDCSNFENHARINFSSSEVNNSILGNSATIGAATFDITKDIDLGANSGGSITFYLTAIDFAGNNVYVSEIYRLGEWVIVEDALVYGGQGVSSSTRLQENDAVWPADPYILRKYFATPTLVDLTNQVLLSQNSGSLLRELRRTTDNSSFQTRNFLGLTITNPYTELMEVHDAKKEYLSGSYTEIPITDGNIAGSLTTLTEGVCTTDYCAIISDGPLTIDAGFVCNKKGLIVSNESITINPNFTNNSDTDACIILANGDINITASGSDSTTPVNYDQIEAFLIARDTIVIDSNGTLDDYGLVVEGGLTAFDPTSGVENGRVIHFSQKENFPALAVKGNSKYGLLSRILFGTQIDIFQSEVGFKPY